MKTTVEIADPLLEGAKSLAAESSMTLREILEIALQRYLEEARKRQGSPFRLRDTSVEGAGLAAGIDEGDWKTIRRLAFEGRGG